MEPEKYMSSSAEEEEAGDDDDDDDDRSNAVAVTSFCKQERRATAKRNTVTAIKQPGRGRGRPRTHLKESSESFVDDTPVEIGTIVFAMWKAGGGRDGVSCAPLFVQQNSVCFMLYCMLTPVAIISVVQEYPYFWGRVTKKRPSKDSFLVSIKFDDGDKRDNVPRDVSLIAACQFRTHEGRIVLRIICPYSSGI